MKIVIDTNIIASALFFGGKPDKLVDLLMEHKVDAYVSKGIISEYYATSAHLAQKYSVRTSSYGLDDIVSQCTLVTPTQTVTISRDPDDNKFIECALEGKCLYIVSGDNDLLDLKAYGDVEIITVAEFFNRYEGIFYLNGQIENQ